MKHNPKEELLSFMGLISPTVIAQLTKFSSGVKRYGLTELMRRHSPGRGLDDQPAEGGFDGQQEQLAEQAENVVAMPHLQGGHEQGNAALKLQEQIDPQSASTPLFILSQKKQFDAITRKLRGLEVSEGYQAEGSRSLPKGRRSCFEVHKGGLVNKRQK